MGVVVVSRYYGLAICSISSEASCCGLYQIWLELIPFVLWFVMVDLLGMSVDDLSSVYIVFLSDVCPVGLFQTHILLC